MIIIFHNNKRVCRVLSAEHDIVEYSKNDTIALVILKLATAFPEKKIAWCHQSMENQLNTDFIKKYDAYKNALFSFRQAAGNYLTDAIGYVENCPFINIPKIKTYPTWLMSSTVGFAHASVFLKIKDAIKPDANFDYFLNSLAKTYFTLGLFCYSEPALLHNGIAVNNAPTQKASRFTLFRFVKQHYRIRWIFLLLFNYMVYERKLPLLPFLFSFVYKRVNPGKYDISDVPFLPHSGIGPEDTVDVLIPTIGRKKYLYDTLQDLKNQDHPPVNVIIVEQNADPNMGSELDYLTHETWPFIIKHTFTHRIGAVNARNIALKQLESKWVFFADDDIRIENSFLSECILNCKNYGKKAITLSCLQKDEKFIDSLPFQWGSFGTCSSFVLSEILQDIRFNLGIELGYGEDYEYGKQIRASGTDVLFFSKPKIFHLKAPMGGFRTKFKFDWHGEKVQPKPSPTVMLYKLLHQNIEEIRGYKTVLFFKYYKRQSVKNPFKYTIKFKKEWNQSVFWANKLNEKNQT
ncbi:MAG: glycosyltransferase family A protein [Flavobacterium sp.]|uniref:glycosyltransferase family 2 protein n=1 Tax=Flavobacterium sp. TaxID=239 RepID=UPI003266A2A8